MFSSLNFSLRIFQEQVIILALSMTTDIIFLMLTELNTSSIILAMYSPVCELLPVSTILKITGSGVVSITFMIGSYL